MGGVLMDSKELILYKNSTLLQVENKVKAMAEKGEINFPINYSHTNALQAAWLNILEIKDKANKSCLEICTKESIQTSLFDMVVQGLSVAKKQGYFIMYGNKLKFMRSYFGSMAAAKRLKGVKDVIHQVVYKKDVFNYSIVDGYKVITEHKQEIDNVNIDEIRCVYCTIVFDNGGGYTEIMTYEQCKKSWERGTTKGGSSAHRDTPDQMCLRTVINRACKYYINSSDDSDLYMQSFDRSDEKDIEEIVLEDIENNANSEVIDVEEIETIEKQDLKELAPGF